MIKKMKKAFVTILLAVVTMLICAGCSSGELEYKENLGYDLNKVKHKDITFNVYHTNPKDKTWERIKSFPCTPEPGHYNDVRLEGKKDKITVLLRDNTCTESSDGSTAAYDGVTVSSFNNAVDGFKGSLPGWESFAVKDEEGEQLVRLYPISNSNAAPTLGDIRLDKAYDTKGKTIDNILITIVMK